MTYKPSQAEIEAVARKIAEFYPTKRHYDIAWAALIAAAAVREERRPPLNSYTDQEIFAEFNFRLLKVLGDPRIGVSLQGKISAPPKGHEHE